MALRECPGCRKRVSDSVNTCIHCGYDFEKAAKEQSEREQQATLQRKFYDLSIDERMEYEREFYDNHVGYKKAMRVSKTVGAFSIVEWLCELPIIIILLIILGVRLAMHFEWIDSLPYQNTDALFAAVVIAIMLMAVGIVCAVVCKIFKNKSNRDLAEYANEFIDWLRETKQLYF